MAFLSQQIVDGALAHMNEDHADGNLLIVRAYADAAATSATMTGISTTAGTWSYTTEAEAGDKVAEVKWEKELAERQDIRFQVVALYKLACEKLGVEPPAHGNHGHGHGHGH